MVRENEAVKGRNTRGKKTFIPHRCMPFKESHGHDALVPGEIAQEPRLSQGDHKTPRPRFLLFLQQAEGPSKNT